MCFSAEASFVASAGLAVVGVATLREIEAPSDRLLAAIPLAFAVHQFIEGLVWWTYPDGAANLIAARTFAFLAYAAWPIFLPFAFYRYERDARRRRRLLPLVWLGTLAGVYFLVLMLLDPVEARLRDGSLQYRFRDPFVLASHIAYGIPVIVAPLSSREPLLKAFGAGLLLAYLVAYYGWFRTHPSVWCHFAAVLSVLILVQFRLRDRDPDGRDGGSERARVRDGHGVHA